MGSGISQPLQDQVASMSPWNTQIVIDNQCTTPVKLFLARDSEEPTVKNAVEHTVPAQCSSFPIHSGWLNEPLATVLVRVGVHEAKIFRLPHATHLKFDIAPCGLKMICTDPMIIEDFEDPGAVPQNDTVPMALREESFLSRLPGSDAPRQSVARAAVESCSWPPPASATPVSPSSYKAASKRRPLQDHVSSVSPWRTQIVVNNQCTTKLRVFLARNAERPAVKDSVEYTVPAQSSSFSITSGWFNEPLATLIVRVGVHEAKIFRVPHAAQLKFDLATCGLKATCTDEMIIEDYSDPGSVPNHDTAPMIMRQSSFSERAPGSVKMGKSITHAPLTAFSWPPPALPTSSTAASPQAATSSEAAASSPQHEATPPQFFGDEPGNFPESTFPEATLHGKPLEAQAEVDI